MNLLLLYPVGGISQVQIKILTTKIIKLLSDQQNILDGTIHEKVIGAACVLGEIKPNQLSMIDSLRILMTSWQLTHGVTKWKHTVKCDCGAWALNMITHDLDPNKFKVLEIYNKALSVESVDASGQPHKYAIQLKPLSNQFLSNIMQSDSTPDPLELTLFQVVSIDNNPNFDQEEIPIPVWRAVRDAVEPEMQQYHNAVTVKQKCASCEVELESTIGFHNVPWLENSNA